MTDIKSLLEKRKQIKKKKPEFNMQDSHKLSRLKRKWRRPRGSDSKMRVGFKGYNKSVEPGYGSPAEVRGLHKSGLEAVEVSSLGELNKIDSKKQGIIISSKVGMKKKITIIKKADELSLKILNIDPKKYVEKVDTALKLRKGAKDKKKKKQEEKKKTAEKKDKKEDKLADKVMSEEEKAESQKKEKDKLLTKKEI